MALRRTLAVLRSAPGAALELDAEGLLPRGSRWSIRRLLESQPRVNLSSHQLQHLYKLSALNPPAQDSQAEQSIKAELEEMIRLVEAVRRAPSSSLKSVEAAQQETGQTLPDGRVWPEGHGMPLELDWGTPSKSKTQSTDEISPSHILKLAKKTHKGFYTAPSPRQPQEN